MHFKCDIKECENDASRTIRPDNNTEIHFCKFHHECYSNIEDSQAKTWKEKIKLLDKQYKGTPK
jgi:hypothetical protein